MLPRTFTSLTVAALLAAVPASADAARRTTAPVKAVVAPVVKAATPVATPVVTAVAPVTGALPSAAAVTADVVANEMTEACEDAATFKAFAAFGDTADYAFAPGGTFEAGAPGWSLSGASVASTNENLGVFGGSKALKINDGGRVVSPWFCVTPANPHFRFVTYGGEVEVEIDYRVIGESDIDDHLVGETNSGSRWQPSSKHELATSIPASKLAKGVLARIIFEAEDDIYVDNVLVDPYRRG